MKFIFPQNYNFENKLFGIIDYNTAIANLLWYAIIFLFIQFFVMIYKLKYLFLYYFVFHFF